MHVKNSADEPPTRSSYANFQRMERDPRRAAQKDLRADWFNAAEYTQYERGKVICKPTGDDFLGNPEDRELWDFDEARLKRIKQSLQQEKIENAKVLADNRYQGSATLIRSEKGERELRRALLGARAAARLEARLAVQHHLKREAAKRATEEKKQEARAEILRALGEDERHWLLSEAEERNRKDAEARAKIPAKGERRHPRKMSAEEKMAARREVKRNNFRQMGLIAGEKRSWSKAKARDSDNSNADLRAGKESKGLRNDANTRIGSCSDKEDRGHVKHSEMQRQCLCSLHSSHTRMRGRRLMRVESMRDLPEEAEEDVVLLHFERPPKRFNPFECKIGTQKKAKHKIESVRPDSTSIENENAPAVEGFPEILLVIVACFSLLWSPVYAAISRHISPVYSIPTMAICVLGDVRTLWVSQRRFRQSGLLGTFVTDFISSRILSYLAWTMSMSFCGPAKATIVVCLMTSYDYGFIKLITHKWCRILQDSIIESEYLAEKADDAHAMMHQSFDIDLTPVYLFTLWNRMIEATGYLLTYLALFSRDSYPSRMLAIIVAAFIRSRFCPIPPSVREGQTTDQLIGRLFSFADEMNQISLPSVTRYIVQEAEIFSRRMENLRK